MNIDAIGALGGRHPQGNRLKAAISRIDGCDDMHDFHETGPYRTDMAVSVATGLNLPDMGHGKSPGPVS
jgi:hypothetical protein